jgi:hypothetical protein
MLGVVPLGVVLFLDRGQATTGGPALPVNVPALEALSGAAAQTAAPAAAMDKLPTTRSTRAVGRRLSNGTVSTEVAAAVSDVWCRYLRCSPSEGPARAP